MAGGRALVPGSPVVVPGLEPVPPGGSIFPSFAGADWEVYNEASGTNEECEEFARWIAWGIAEQGPKPVDKP